MLSQNPPALPPPVSGSAPPPPRHEIRVAAATSIARRRNRTAVMRKTPRAPPHSCACCFLPFGASLLCRNSTKCRPPLELVLHEHLGKVAIAVEIADAT